MQWNYIFKVLKEKNWQGRILYPGKSYIHKMSKFVAIRPSLQEMLKFVG